MNEERFAKEMKKIQSVVSRALQKANALTALADGGKMSREKLQLTLEETAYFFESATLYLRALCETQMPGVGGYGRRDGLEFQLPSGHIEIAGAGWVHMQLDTAKHLRAVPRRSAKSAAHNGKKNRRASGQRRKRRRRNLPALKNSGPSSVTPLRRRYCSQKPFLNGLNFTNRRLPESRPPMQAIWILTESTLPKPLETCRSTRSPRTPYRTIIKGNRKTAVVWMGGKAACPQRPFRTSICC